MTLTNLNYDCRKLCRLFSLLSISLGIGGLVNCQANEKAANPLVITEEGVGPINAQIPFDVSRIAELLPSLKVMAGVDSSEGIEYPIIKIMDNGTELAEIYPTQDHKGINSISVRSPKVLNSGKGQVGSLYSAIYSATNTGKCMEGYEEMYRDIFCDAPGQSHLRFVFHRVDNGNDSSVPSLEKRMPLRVTEITWVP